MKVAVFLPRLARYGGVESYGLGLTKALHGAGFSVTVACARQEVPVPEGVEVLTFGRFGGLRAVKQAWFAGASARLLRRRTFDVTIGLGKSWGHDLHRINQGPEATFMALTERAYGGWRKRAKAWRRRMSPETYMAQLAERGQLRCSRRLVYVSHLVRDWTMAAYPWAEAVPSRIVYTRPDPERFVPASPDRRAAARAKFGLRDGQTAIGFAATGFARKGLAQLIRALGRLQAQDPQLLVAGGGSTQRYRKLAGELGLDKRVHFLGRQENTAAVYHASDVVCLPSFYDTASNVVLEALACGVPVVASANDGSSYFVPPASVVNDPADPEEIAVRLDTTLAAQGWTPLRSFAEVDSGFSPILEDARLLADGRTAR